MTVENTNPIQHLTANGQSTVFAINFAVENKNNLKVTVNGTTVSVNDYSYNSSTNAVVFNTAPVNGTEVVVERVTSLERSVNYQTYNNSFRPETLNYDLDRIWRVLQEQNIVDAEILARLKDEIDWRIAHDNQVLANIDNEADQRRLVDERIRDEIDQETEDRHATDELIREEIAQEVEARRTHDLNYDTLAQVRDLQVFGALKDYLDTIIASTSPNVFGGVTAGIVFALDKKSVQTHLEDIYQKIVEERQALQAEESRAKAAENSIDQRAKSAEQVLDQKIDIETNRATAAAVTLQANITTETNRAVAAEQTLRNQINANGVGNRSYLTYAEMVADQANITANQKATVTNDPTSSKNGDYQYNGTTFTKAAYDILTQAKTYTTDQIQLGINRTNGHFLYNPYFEKSGNDLYVKLTQYSDGNTFFIRANNKADSQITYDTAITTLSSYFGEDKYPVTSPSGVEGCFKLVGTDYIVYDEVAKALIGISRPSIATTSNYTIIVANNYTEVGRCIEEAAILNKLLTLEIERKLNISRNTNPALVVNGNNAQNHHENLNANLKSIARNRIVYETATRKMYIPTDTTVYTDTSASVAYRFSAPVEVDCTSGFQVNETSTTSLCRVYLNLENGSLYAKPYTYIPTRIEMKTWVCFCVIRHQEVNARIVDIYATFDFTIDGSVNGLPLGGQRPLVIMGATAENTLVGFNTTQKTITFPRDTLLKYESLVWVLDSDKVVDVNLSTSAYVVYWNLIDNSFITKAWSETPLSTERYSLLPVMAVRNGSQLITGGKGVQSIKIDASFKYAIDGKLFGIQVDSVVKNFLDDTVKAVNHRGFNTAPENTLPAYILSNKQGYSYVECDISFTQDGVPVLLHDDTVNRTSNGTGSIKDLTLEQVKVLDFGAWKNQSYAGTTIPTFEEFLKLCHRLNLHPYIELKTSTPIDSAKATLLVNLVKKTGLEGRVSWISFSSSQLNQIKLVDPKARLGLVGTASKAMFNQALALKTGQNEVFVDCATGTGTTYELVQEALALGLPYEVWTENTKANVVKLADYGVTGISTDNLNIREILNEAG